jgi:hypothetical protein
VYASRKNTLLKIALEVGIFAVTIRNNRSLVQCIIDQAMNDLLPDNVLLEIFYFYKDDNISGIGLTWSWRTLIHVCRRWRHVVFGSPLRLNLRLACSSRTPTRRLLDIWPPFPISMFSLIDRMADEECLENIMATLECRDRISFIYIRYDIGGSASEKSMAAMHEQFPLLTEYHLISSSKSVSMPVLSETFLGGSAPLLVMFELRGIPFPTFPKFVLSSTRIQHLSLDDIPDSGYISPEVMVTCLTALPNLRHLSIGFRSPPPHPVKIMPPSQTRVVLPALTRLSFEGVSEYFEDFIARIDAPQSYSLTLTFFMDLIFDCPRLHNFINRIERDNEARMEFTSQEVRVILGSRSQFMLGIKCERLDWQLSSMTQIFSQQLPLLSHLEYFEIREPDYSLHRIGWEDDPDMDPSQWLELFRLLIAVQSLYVSERLVHRVAAALKEVTGDAAMEVLPALRTLSLEGPGLQTSSESVQDAIKPFVTTRQLINHPVIIQPWEAFPRLDVQPRG